MLDDSLIDWASESSGRGGQDSGQLEEASSPFSPCYPASPRFLSLSDGKGRLEDSSK